MASDTPISNIGASLGYTATQAAPKLAFSLTVTNRNAFEVMLLNPADYLSIVLYDYTGQLMELAVESLPPVKINSKSPVPSRSFAILSARALTKNGDHDIELRQEVKIPPNGSLRFECAIEEILVKLGVSQGKIIRGLDPGQYSMNLTLTLIGAGQVGSKIARVEKAVLHLR